MNLDIYKKRKRFTTADGKVMEWDAEAARVSVKLGGVTREIEITRSGPGSVWSYEGPVLAQVGRGTKVHTRRFATLYPKGDHFEFGYTVICNRSARVFAWADEHNTGNSGWTNNSLS